MTSLMSKTFFWTEGFDDHMWAVIFNHTIKTLWSLFDMFYPIMKGLIAINDNLGRLAAAAATAAAEARASMDEIVKMHRTSGNDAYAKDVVAAEAKWVKKNNRSEYMGKILKLAKLGFTDIIHGQVGAGVGQAFGRSDNHIAFHGKHPGSETPQESNKLNLEDFIRSSCMRARSSLRAGSEALFSGAILEPDGQYEPRKFTVRVPNHRRHVHILNVYHWRQLSSGSEGRLDGMERSWN